MEEKFLLFSQKGKINTNYINTLSYNIISVNLHIKIIMKVSFNLSITNIDYIIDLSPKNDDCKLCRARIIHG